MCFIVFRVEIIRMERESIFWGFFFWFPGKKIMVAAKNGLRVNRKWWGMKGGGVTITRQISQVPLFFSCLVLLRLVYGFKYIVSGDCFVRMLKGNMNGCFYEHVTDIGTRDCFVRI